MISKNVNILAFRSLFNYSPIELQTIYKTHIFRKKKNIDGKSGSVIQLFTERFYRRVINIRLFNKC